MDNICRFNKFGYCKYKDKCKKDHVNEECRDGHYCESVKTCTLRHPKMCKRIILEGLCGFAEKCAYSHKRRSNLSSLENANIHEEVKILKAEVDALKKVLKSLIAIREESEDLKKAVEDIKDEIKFLDSSNREVVSKIIKLEKDLADDSDNESETLFEPMVVKKVDKSNSKKSAGDLKCEKCGFIGQTNVSLKKHVNTKHPDECFESSKIEGVNLPEADCILDGIDDLFQMEIVEGEKLYVCNVCDKGFEEDDKIRKHIQRNHKEIILQINKEINEESESDSNSGEESYGDAWLEKFDEDGNFIG